MESALPGQDPAAIEVFLERARRGDEGALPELIRAHEPRLLRMVGLRMDPSLRARLDPADVVQEASVEALRRFPEWCAQSELSFHLWLRLVTAQALAQIHRRHLGAHMRDALREVRGPEARPGVSATSATDVLIASTTSPTLAARREELRARVLGALEELGDLDREIVVLRHYEGLTNEEAAAELAITPAAASKRFLRALVRLRPTLLALKSESAAGRA